MHSFWELPPIPGTAIVQRAHYRAFLHRMPIPQVVEPRSLGPDDVEAAVLDSHALVSRHGAKLLAWWTGVDHPWLGTKLEALGLRNEDASGFESVENAMALVEPPIATSHPRHDLEITQVRTIADFAAAVRVRFDAFGVTKELRAEAEAGMADRYAEHAASTNPLRTFIASRDGRVVGAASGVLGTAGVNLIGGCVLEEARGHGIYRALTIARWELAVARGTPALTIQAGRMSRPIVERLGFKFIAAVPIYIDRLSS
jgi:GNAT superfamily N-acetyltransferase